MHAFNADLINDRGKMWLSSPEDICLEDKCGSDGTRFLPWSFVLIRRKLCDMDILCDVDMMSTSYTRFVWFEKKEMKKISFQMTILFLLYI